MVAATSWKVDRSERKEVVPVLNDNIRALRKSQGLSQSELAVKLNVVRQTVSKWEKGLSVPDSEMLVCLAEALQVPVSTLLGEAVAAPQDTDGLKAVAAKLEVVNLQLARQAARRRRAWLVALALVCLAVVGTFSALILSGSPYLDWDYSDPETAVLGVGFHAFEWLFARLAPLVLIAAVAGIAVILVRRKA